MKPTPKPSDAVAMHSETPQILQKKPGEPGGEKALVAKELFDSLSDHAPIPTVLLNQEQFTRAVAGALAACALEARLRCVAQLKEMARQKRLCAGNPDAPGEYAEALFNDADLYEQAGRELERGAALERAAEGKA